MCVWDISQGILLQEKLVEIFHAYIAKEREVNMSWSIFISSFLNPFCLSCIFSVHLQGVPQRELHCSAARLCRSLEPLSFLLQLRPAALWATREAALLFKQWWRRPKCRDAQEKASTWRGELHSRGKRSSVNVIIVLSDQLLTTFFLDDDWTVGGAHLLWN